MSRLEDLKPNAAVRGILPDRLVTIVNVEWIGTEALELTFKDPNGQVANQLLYRSDEDRFEVAEEGRPWSFDGDGSLFRLVSEARRIRLAHLFDPVLADQATATRTIGELEAEIATLRNLEKQALQVRQDGEDRKWRELAQLLSEIFSTARPEGYEVGEDELSRPRSSPRQKRVIFTEHRDTLDYLENRSATRPERTHRRNHYESF